MKRIGLFLSLALLTVGMVGCDKEENKDNGGSHSDATPYGLVLNEGGWGANNGSISLLYDDGTVDNQWFADNNGRGLGDVAQDVMAYGSKVYAVVTFSSTLEAIDPATGKSTQVDLEGRKPRYLAADGGKLYVTCYDMNSVVRIDTATLEVEATCLLGDYQPEGIAIVGGKAFVASGYYSDCGGYLYDNKVYVIDLAAFANPTTVEVGCNPSIVKKIDESRVLVCYAGDYGTKPAGSAVIDVNSLAVTHTETELANVDVYDGKVYGYASTWKESGGDWTQSIAFFSLDPVTMVSTPILEDCGIENPYGLSVDPANGDIYVMTDGNYQANGDVVCFTHEGVRRFSSEAGMLPKKVLFL